MQGRLKQIAVAIHTYADITDNSLVPEVYDSDQKPLLSWRVLLLPHLGEEELFKQFRLNERWDSEHNKRLIEKMPVVYAPTRVKAGPGETFYRGFAGNGRHAGLFAVGKKHRLYQAVTDGTSNTILLIDAGTPAVWTQPATDLDTDPTRPLPKLGGMIDGEFYCVMTNGWVSTIRRDFDEGAMRAAITPSGGELLDWSKVFVK